MQKYLIFWLLFCSLLFQNDILYGQKFAPKYLRENDKSLLSLTSQYTEDGWLIFNPDSESIEASKFTSRFQNSLGLSGDYQLWLVKDKTDVKETRHQHFQLLWKNIVVEGGHLTLHSRKGVLKSVHSRIIDGLALNPERVISESQALESAVFAQKISLADFKNNLPKGQLILTSQDGNFATESYQLAYTFDILGGRESGDIKKALGPNRVYINAISGAVIKSVPLVSKCFDAKYSHGKVSHNQLQLLPTTQNLGKPLQAATFNSLHPRGNPTPSFEVEPLGTDFRLSMSTNVPQALITRVDLNNNAWLWANQNPPQINNAWDDPEVTNSSTNWGTNAQAATLSHWAVWRCYQYFLNRFNMNGTDGQGTIARVLSSPGYADGPVWWRNERLMVVEANPQGQVAAAVDIIGHEYGHGVSNHLVGGWTIFDGETGSLNEGFSDIMGSVIERELQPDGGPNGGDWYWQMGENAWYVRNMADPNIFGHPKIYHEPGFWNSTNPQLVHINAGVLDKWFHTLITGKGPNGDITPISSINDAMSVVYWALENYIYGDYNYANTANALRIAAGAVFGECSPQQRAVAAAWGAVGIPTSYICSPDCNFTATAITPTSVNCNQAMTLSSGCTAGPGNSNGWECQGITYTYSGPNVPYNPGSNPSLNVTAPASAGTYQYSLAMSKSGAGCYTPTFNFNVSVNCGSTPTCDFSNGPRYVGTWSNLVVQIRSISGRNVLVTAIPGSSDDKYYPRGDNFWGSFNQDPNAAGLQSCLNAGTTDWGGLTNPSSIAPPAGYYQGTEQDGAVYYAQNGTNPPNPCDFSSGPRHVGTWNNLNVEIRQFPNGKRALVTAEPNAYNDKYYPRGDNFWDNFTKDSGVENLQGCLNAGTTGWWGLEFPTSITPPSGYQQGTTQDGAVYFSTNGLRVGAQQETIEEVSLVKVRPNPVHNEVIVTFMLKEASDVQLRLLDVQGRVYQQHTHKGIAGKNERVLTVSSLATGVYALEVILERQRIIHKLVKE
ncbi:M4 family metallopeptidase [Spirosoma endbachense]|nr:M4 family metallopeptidase [Spirosoma endbachense]